MNFAEIERMVAKLRQELAAGRLAEEQFKARLRELMVEDTEGNWWMVGYETGEWYRHDGTDWVRADPPGHVAPRATPQPMTQSIAPAKPKRGWLTRSAWFWGIILALVGILLLLDNLGYLRFRGLWPLFLVAAGLWILWSAFFGGPFNLWRKK
jgi:hypothetical protein